MTDGSGLVVSIDRDTSLAAVTGGAFTNGGLARLREKLVREAYDHVAAMPGGGTSLWQRFRQQLWENKMVNILSSHDRVVASTGLPLWKRMWNSAMGWH